MAASTRGRPWPRAPEWASLQQTPGEGYRGLVGRGPA